MSERDKVVGQVDCAKECVREEKDGPGGGGEGGR